MNKKEVYKCTICEGWFIKNNMSCAVLHSTGDCCHLHEERINAPILFKKKLNPKKCKACLKANKLEEGGFDLPSAFHIASSYLAEHLRDYHCTCGVKDA